MSDDEAPTDELIRTTLNARHAGKADEVLVMEKKLMLVKEEQTTFSPRLADATGSLKRRSSFESEWMKHRKVVKEEKAEEEKTIELIKTEPQEEKEDEEEQGEEEKTEEPAEPTEKVMTVKLWEDRWEEEEEKTENP